MGLEPVPDTSVAQWILEGIAADARSVRSEIPDVFEAYCRVLHAARRYNLAADNSIEDEGPATWAEIAAANGRILHAEAQFEAIVGLAKYGENQAVYDHGQPPVWNTAPSEGSLELPEVRTLSSILRGHTSSDVWYFAHWEGYGDLAIDRKVTARFGHPLPQAGRDHLLFSGPPEALFETLAQHGYRSPNLWWPEDRAWLVVSDIDLDSTYIGGTAGCIEEIVGAQGPEVLRVEPTYGITRDSDRINPVPPIE